VLPQKFHGGVYVGDYFRVVKQLAAGFALGFLDLCSRPVIEGGGDRGVAFVSQPAGDGLDELIYAIGGLAVSSFAVGLLVANPKIRGLGQLLRESEQRNFSRQKEAQTAPATGN